MKVFINGEPHKDQSLAVTDTSRASNPQQCRKGESVITQTEKQPYIQNMPFQRKERNNSGTGFFLCLFVCFSGINYNIMY